MNSIKCHPWVVAFGCTWTCSGRMYGVNMTMYCGIGVLHLSGLGWSQLGEWGKMFNINTLVIMPYPSSNIHKTNGHTWESLHHMVTISIENWLWLFSTTFKVFLFIHNSQSYLVDSKEKLMKSKFYSQPMSPYVNL